MGLMYRVLTLATMDLGLELLIEPRVYDLELGGGMAAEDVAGGALRPAVVDAPVWAVGGGGPEAAAVVAGGDGGGNVTLDSFGPPATGSAAAGAVAATRPGAGAGGSLGIQLYRRLSTGIPYLAASLNWFRSES